MTNLVHEANYRHIRDGMDANLRSVVKYPLVAKQVATYNKRSLRLWIHDTTSWRDIIQDPKQVRWGDSWQVNSTGAFAALEEWLSRPDDVILPCRH
jgi:hypothetical protein